MKKKQAILLLLITCSLVLTLLLGSIIYYFSDESAIIGVSAQAEENLTHTVSSEYNIIENLSLKRTGESADRELRGVWISSVYNIDFPSKSGLSAAEQKAELDAIIQTAKAANLNTVFFQVRPTSDALYKSEIYPTSAYLTGKQGAQLADDFDPLEYIVEKAHENNLELHAWINPFRVTPGSKTTYEADVAALSANNPAVLHKEWTIAYEDGKLYFDPGNPSARQLIISGAVEIVEKYDVDGIHIDDYFYPYPVYVTDADGRKSIAEFNDDVSFELYGKGMERGDWRRENINIFVRDLKNAIKEVRSDCEFGVSCAGIWANAGSLEDGSDTNGMQSYFDTYADSKYWIENELVDYICPQIYWEMSHKTAPFDVLCKWWSSVVDGTNVKLYIGHALYKNPNWSDKTELIRQVEFARSWHGYKGSVFFGFDQLKNNIDGMLDRISNVFYEEYFHPNIPSTGEPVTFGSPQPTDILKAGKTYILGKSNPAYPLYFNGKKLARTQNGYFNMYVDIKNGDNAFKFTQNGVDTVITLTTNVPENKPVNENLGGLILKSVFPNQDIIAAPGDDIELSCIAPAGSNVTATLGGKTVKLKAQSKAKLFPKYEPQSYSATLKLPVDFPQDSITDLGNIIFKAVLSGETVSAAGASVRVKPNDYKAYIEVINDYSYLKISPTSSFYNDYLPASVGMRDYVEKLENGYYKLRFGGYIAQDNAKFVEGILRDGNVLSVEGASDEKSTVIKFNVTENIPINAFCKDGIFTLELFNVDTQSVQDIPQFQNPLFDTFAYVTDKENDTVIYKLYLKNTENYYGFNVEYDDGAVIFTFRNPIKLELDSDLPLVGISVIVDAGHGGADVGALGFVSEGGAALNEKELNLLVAKSVEKYLTAYGANVIMIRTEDNTVTLEERMQFLNENLSDLVISVHHNSLEYSSDVTRVRGLLGLWWNDSGRLLTKSISSAVAEGLSRYERTPTAQKLAMCRNHKFPSTLIELGFITSAEEYEYITRLENIDLAGRSIAKGVIRYFEAQQQYI